MRIFPKSLEELAQCLPTRFSPNMNCLYHFTSLENFLKIWATQKLLLCSRKRMNDSAEQEEMLSGVRNYADFLAYGYAIEEYKQLSLSYNEERPMYLSPTMWGLYAKSNTGVCIELDSTKLNLDSGTYIGGFVEYKGEIPNSPRLPYGTPFQSISEAVDFVEQHIHEIYFRKYEDWGYEHEYRIISKKKEFIDISGAISCVYIFNMDIAEYNIIDGLNSQLPEDKRLKFRSIQQRSDKYNTKILKVYDAKDEYNRLKKLERGSYVKQGEEEFEKMLKEHQEKSMRKLNL